MKSFIVGRKFREIREYSRYHKKLVQERARQVNRIEKLLQMNGFKLSSVISDITGASGLRLLAKLRDNGSVTLTDVIMSLDRRIKSTPEEIESAINGQMKLTSRFLLGKMLSKLAVCDKEIAEIYEAMKEISHPYRSQIALIDSIPGLGELSAMYIVAEIGADVSSFKTANHFTAWAGLSPKDRESAGKLKSSKTQKANIYIRSVLTECAWAATKARNTRLSNWYWSNVSRLGEKKAITAVARKLLVYIYAMLKSGEMYDDSLDAADTVKRKAEKLDSAHKIVARQINNSNAQKRPDNIAADSFADTESLPHINTDIQDLKNETANAINSTEAVIKKKRGRPRKVKPSV